jgi:hypothetical protein
MQYMFLIYSKESEGMSEDQANQIRRAHGSVLEETSRCGILLGVERLHPTVTATSVRTSAEGAMVTDGPFAETKEQLAGYYILECADLDEAIEWAKRIPSGCRGGEGCIEIRPVAPLKKP